MGPTTKKNLCVSGKEVLKMIQGTLTERERLSTIDLLIKVTCFVTDINNIFYAKRSLYKLVSTRRSTVLKPSISARAPWMILRT